MIQYKYNKAIVFFTVICFTNILWGQDNPQRHPAEPEMVFVEGGTFMIGSPEVTSGYEYPAHKVTVSSFYIGKYEITQKQWKLIMGTSLKQQCVRAGETSIEGEGDDYPMYYVSWEDAQEFIRRLNEATGKQYRLPTEAEWEYAARGGNKSKNYKYSGSNNLDDVAWYRSNSEGSTRPIGTKRPNELEIYDMSGNVWEWCYDWAERYSSSDQHDPIGPSSGATRVIRGGDWNNGDHYCRVSARSWHPPIYASYLLGFRVVLPQ